MDDRDLYRPGPCPVCKTPASATMGSTRWGHDFTCCSDKCGMAAGEALRKLYDTETYQFLRSLEHNAGRQAQRLMAEAVSTARGAP